MRFASAPSGSGTDSIIGRDLEAIGLHADPEVKDCFHLSFEALSADVCRYRNLDRQRAAKEIQKLGSLDSEAVQTALPGQTDA